MLSKLNDSSGSTEILFFSELIEAVNPKLFPDELFSFNEINEANFSLVNSLASEFIRPLFVYIVISVDLLTFVSPFPGTNANWLVV